MDTKEDIIGSEFFNWVNDMYGNHTKIPENVSDIFVLWYLHEHKMLKYCSYCQFPGCVDKKPCNDCPSCNLHNSALEYCKKKKWEFFAL